MNKIQLSVKQLTLLLACSTNTDGEASLKLGGIDGITNVETISDTDIVVDDGNRIPIRSAL